MFHISGKFTHSWQSELTVSCKSWNSNTFESKLHTITENSEIHDLTCYRLNVKNDKVTCSWQAEPPAASYNVVFSTPDGHEIFNMTVRVEHATHQLRDYAGDAVMVSVNSASTIIELPGLSDTIYLRSSHWVVKTLVVALFTYRKVLRSHLLEASIWKVLIDHHSQRYKNLIRYRNVASFDTPLWKPQPRLHHI